jgi:hypothetical protein
VIDYPAPRRRLPRRNFWLAEVRHKGGLAKAGAHIRNRTSFSFPIAKAISRNGGLGSRCLKYDGCEAITPCSLAAAFSNAKALNIFSIFPQQIHG